MSVIQMSFSIMPALVFLFAGLAVAAGSSGISIGTLVAFTTLQTRFGFPIRSLLDVGHRHPHVACPVRADLRVSRHAGYRFSGGEKQRIAIARTIAQPAGARARRGDVGA